MDSTDFHGEYAVNPLEILCLIFFPGCFSLCLIALFLFRSFDLLVKDLDGKNHQMTINNLLSSIDVQESSQKVCFFNDGLRRVAGSIPDKVKLEQGT